MVTTEEQEYLTKYMQEKTFSAEEMSKAHELYLKDFMNKNLHKEFHKDIYAGLYFMAFDDDVPGATKPDEITYSGSLILGGALSILIFFIGVLTNKGTVFEVFCFSILMFIAGFIGSFIATYDTLSKKTKNREFRHSISKYNQLYESLYSTNSRSENSQWEDVKDNSTDRNYQHEEDFEFDEGRFNDDRFSTPKKKQNYAAATKGQNDKSISLDERTNYYKYVERADEGKIGGIKALPKPK